MLVDRLRCLNIHYLHTHCTEVMTTVFQTFMVVPHFLFQANVALGTVEALGLVNSIKANLHNIKTLIVEK